MSTTKRHNEVNPLSDLLKQMINESKLKNGLNKVAIKDVWLDQMGQGINAYTDEIYLKGHTLYVVLRSSVIRQELSYGKDKIIKMINEALGEDIVEKVVLK